VGKQTVARIYVANIALLGDSDVPYYEGANEPPKVATGLTGGADIWIWPTSDVVDFRLPSSGDYIFFFHIQRDRDRVLSGRDKLVGIGQVFATTQDELARQAIRYADFNIRVNPESVVSIINYQTAEDAYYLGNIFHELSRIPEEDPLQLVDSEVAKQSGFDSPLQGISNMGGFSVERFMRPPNDPDGGGPPIDSENGNGGSGEIDRTGTLLEGQYTGRDAIREAATDGLKIAILLLGIIIASLSFLRGSFQNGALVISSVMYFGAGGIGFGAIVSTAVIIISVMFSRPQARKTSNQQGFVNKSMMASDDRDRQGHLQILSSIYHFIVRDIQFQNTILGSLAGGAVGISLAGIFLIAMSVVRQTISNEIVNSIMLIFVITSISISAWSFCTAIWVIWSKQADIFRK
jgi:hypothetical protein